MKFIKGARTWRSILGTQTFFWPLTHPPVPPPRYSINQPLSKGLAWASATCSRPHKSFQDTEIRRLLTTADVRSVTQG